MIKVMLQFEVNGKVGEIVVDGSMPAAIETAHQLCEKGIQPVVKLSVAGSVWQHLPLEEFVC